MLPQAKDELAEHQKDYYNSYNWTYLVLFLLYYFTFSTLLVLYLLQNFDYISLMRYILRIQRIAKKTYDAFSLAILSINTVTIIVKLYV